MRATVITLLISVGPLALWGLAHGFDFLAEAWVGHKRQREQQRIRRERQGDLERPEYPNWDDVVDASGPQQPRMN